MSRVSSHSGLREEYELRDMEIRCKERKEKYDKKMETVCNVLNTMPPAIRRRFLVEIIKKYEK